MSTQHNASTTYHGHSLTIGTDRLVAATVCITIYLIVLLMNYGIVYYEREAPDMHRTLINKMVAVASILNMLLASMVAPIVTIKLLNDLSAWNDCLCTINRFLLIFFVSQLVLVYNEIIWLRIVYLSVGHVGVVNEDLLKVYLNTINILVAMGTAAGRTMTHSSNNILLGLCKEEPDKSKTVPITLIEYILVPFFYNRS